MVSSGRNKTSALQRLARWPTASPSSSTANWTEAKKYGVSVEMATFQPINHESLVQGSLYITKVKVVTIGLFEGWNDDMCCFSVLRSDTGSMRWSEARYLPGEFDAFDAFDEAGNPPVYFWTRYLRTEVPLNWFSIFEEARRKQRVWSLGLQQEQEQYIYEQQQQEQQHHDQVSLARSDDDDDLLSFPAPPSSISSLPLGGIGNKASVLSSYDLDVSFSQVRHGSPTVFSDMYDHRTTSVPPPSLFNQHSTANPSSDQLVYSPTPSIQCYKVISSINNNDTTDSNQTESTPSAQSPSSIIAMLPIQTNEIDNHNTALNRHNHNPANDIANSNNDKEKKLNRSISIKSLSKKRRSIGMF